MGITISEFDALDDYDKVMHLEAGRERDMMTAWEMQLREDATK